MKSVFPSKKKLVGCTVPVGNNYTVMVQDVGDEYDCYIRQNIDGRSTPFLFMFGCLKSNTSYREAIQLAIANVPEYLDLFEE